MTGGECNILDAPGCPLLGLAADQRTRYTYPDPAHRCYARLPGAIEPGRQVAYCLSVAFVTCDRYGAWKQQASADKRPGSLPPADTAARPPGSPSTPRAQEAMVTHVWRSGDSLARIASAYGLTVDQVAAANDLASLNAIEDGQRLVIPLGRPAAGATGRTSPRGRIGPVDGAGPRSR